MTIQEKLEAKAEQMKAKNKDKKKATRKQKIVAAVIIPISAVLVATAIASPNNNHRDTAPPPPADTSHHATSQKQGNVKFNGESPDVEKALDKIRSEIGFNSKLSDQAKVDSVIKLAKESDVSSQLLNDYTNALVISVRNGAILENSSNTGDLITLYKAALVAEKNHHAGFNGTFADEYVAVQSALYLNQDARWRDDVQAHLAKIDSVINSVEY
jgi:hypothetical protein